MYEPSYSPDELARIGQLLLTKSYRFAKTMPHAPHWYSVRREWKNEEEFVEAVLFIRKHGYSEPYAGRNYIKFKLNGFKYWTMGDPIEDTIILNRAKCGTAGAYDSSAYEAVAADRQKTPAYQVEVSATSSTKVN